MPRFLRTHQFVLVLKLAFLTWKMIEVVLQKHLPGIHGTGSEASEIDFGFRLVAFDGSRHADRCLEKFAKRNFVICWCKYVCRARCIACILGQSCTKFKRRSFELKFLSSFLSYTKKSEGNFELELKGNSLKILANFLNSTQLCSTSECWHRVESVSEDRRCPNLIAIVLVVLAFLGCRLYKHVELVIGHRKFVEGATPGVQDHPEFWEVV